MKRLEIIQIHRSKIILHKRIWFLTIFFLLNFIITNPANSQDFATTPQSHINAPRDNFWDRVYTGGGIGLQFGSQTFINVSPLIGYRLTEKFSVGLSATYLYYRYKDYNPAYSFSSNTYGGSVFSRYLIFENLFAHVEYEVLRLEARDNVSRLLGTKDITSVLVGGGYRQMLGDRSSINLMLLYNLNETTYSPYQNPIIRISFGIGI